MNLQEIQEELLNYVTLTQAQARRFFKCEPEQYAAHDQFLGITVSHLRILAKKYKSISIDCVQELLSSPYNECRLLGLLILVMQYQKSTPDQQKNLYHFYLKNIEYINNWNLVDSSAHHIVGHYLFDKDIEKLYKLATSKNVWHRRIAIVATWYFIRQSKVDVTFTIAKLLLNDKHDLIHKAVGWMLREAGKKDEALLIIFLNAHANQMAKTMLRYAVEKLPNKAQYTTK
ncbi:DNA alkylation repair protein [Candidatus Dependentiae bacterium]|nr:MAG: DNA alkylation repair protein [Candidatus Dependentiae bacterium]